MDLKERIVSIDPRLVRSAELPFLASEVAIDLESYSKGIKDEKDSIVRLSEFLYALIEEENPFLSPDKCIIFSEAINSKNYFYKNRVRTRGDLMEAITQLAGELRDYRTLPRERQEQLRDFCVALSQRAASYQNYLYSLRRRGCFR